MIKLFKKEKNLKKEKASLWSGINLYWKLAVSFMLVVVLISFAFGFYLLKQINKEPPLQTNIESEQTAIVKKERIGRVLEYFSEREKRSNEILNSPAPIIDPSL